MHWWGSFELPTGYGGCWRIGPLELWAQRRAEEWRISTRNNGDRFDASLDIPSPNQTDGSAELPGTLARFSAAPEDTEIELAPVLADRPVVIRPESPFHVAAHGEVTFFTSTPLWVRVSAGEPRQRLIEVPTWRPSDTWFGPSTTEGSLCYAGRTVGRLQPEELPLRAHRAATAVTVHNGADSLLAIERMLIPVEHLSLFVRPDGFLETQPVTLSSSSTAGAAFALSLVDEPRTAGVERVAGPREKLEQQSVVRALASFFS